MKTFSLTILILFQLSGHVFAQEFERIKIDGNLSIEIPADFSQQKENMWNGHLIVADSENDKCFIAFQNEETISKLSNEERNEMIVNNIKGFLRGINGEQLQYEDIETLKGWLYSDFTFTIKLPQLMAGYGKILNRGSKFLLLAYLVSDPTSEISTLTRDHVFNSLKL